MAFTVGDAQDMDYVGRIDAVFDRIDAHLASLVRGALAHRFRERAAAYFRRVVDRPTPLSAQQLIDLIDSPDAVRYLTDEERDDVLFAELVVRGRARTGEGDVYAVVEVAVNIGPNDVNRAARRASLLGRLCPTVAAVAGRSISPEAEVLAQSRGLWHLLYDRDRALDVRSP